MSLPSNEIIFKPNMKGDSLVQEKCGVTVKIQTLIVDRKRWS